MSIHQKLDLLINRIGTISHEVSETGGNSSTSMSPRELLNISTNISIDGEYTFFITVFIYGQFQTNYSEDILVYKNDILLEPLFKRGKYNISFDSRLNFYVLNANKNDIIHVICKAANNCAFTAQYDLLRLN